jgi:dimethylsulfone monooxygenase
MTKAQQSAISLARPALYNDNRLKLGLFGFNARGGMAITEVPTDWREDWDYHRQLVQTADDLGFELLIPVGRWKGVGGSTDWAGSNYETFTYASAIAAVTKNLMTFATAHVPLFHPVIAAKMAASIDQVSAGRFGLNVVMGWNTPELEMFGHEQRDHESRYLYGAEWLDVVEQLWSRTDTFDYDGEFFHLKQLRSEPKPVQKPRPVVFSAGSSPTGADWAARHADFNFAAVTEDLDEARRYVAGVHQKAKEYDREVGVLCAAFVVCRDTTSEAQDAYAEIKERGDWEGIYNWISTLGIQSQSNWGPDASGVTTQHDPLLEHFVTGGGNPQIVGNPGEVADQLAALSDVGFDAIILGLLNWNIDLPYFGSRVMPLLEKRGLRQPMQT